MKIDLLPDFAKKYKTTGFDVRKRGDSYVLYKISSKRVPDKNYPVLQQTFIGVIDPVKGLIEKKKRLDPVLSDYLEFGLSNFLYLNFKSFILRHTFQPSDTYAKLVIAYYMFGSLDERFLLLSYLTATDPDALRYAKTINRKRVSDSVNNLQDHINEVLHNEDDRRFILEALRLIVIRPNSKTMSPTYSEELLNTLNKYKVKI